jgi:hypothetical protein
MSSARLVRESGSEGMIWDDMAKLLQKLPGISQVASFCGGGKIKIEAAVTCPGRGAAPLSGAPQSRDRRERNPHHVVPANAGTHKHAAGVDTKWLRHCLAKS